MSENTTDRKESVTNLGAVTISRKGYIEDLERQLAEASHQVEKYAAEARSAIQENERLFSQLAEARAQRNDARGELAEWKTLQSWGGTPEIINDFIKGQQNRIHAAQHAEEQRDRLAEAHQQLLEKCDDSDDAHYGTLSTTFVREHCQKALAALNQPGEGRESE
jgi:chromosome segregation ATPase